MRNKKLKIGFLPTLLVLVAMLVVACGGTGNTGSTTPTPTTRTKAAQDKQIYIGAAGAGIDDFGTLDPALVSDQNSGWVIASLFTGLVELDNNLTVKCVLCSSYGVASDNVTWTFKLRSGLQFSDGKPLTSADVVYSITRALSPATQSPLGLYYLNIIKGATDFNSGKTKTLAGISAPDANTVVIVARKPAAYFLQTLTYPTSYVVEQSVIKQWGTAWINHLTDNGGQGGAGPWKVQEYTHSKQIVLVPNPNYFGLKPQLAKVVYPIYKSADTTYQVYQVNGIDITGVPSTHVTTDRQRPDYRATPQLAIFYYSMNYNQKPFDVTSCRQAFALAINKDAIAKSVWKNTVVATNHIVPKGEYGYNPNLTGPDGTTSTAGNPTKAMQAMQSCMQAQGYASMSNFPPITLTYASSGIQDARNEVAALQQMWQNVLGISVKIDDVTFNKLVGDENLGANNPLQMFSGPGWIADYPDPQDWTTLQFDKNSNGASNPMSFGQNKGPDAAAQQAVQLQLEQADVNLDAKAREQAYFAAEQQLVNYVAWLPIYQQITSELVKPCVQGRDYNALSQTFPDDWAKVYISTDTPCASLSS
jgi:peptide/nickel transport system substrate-binding protein/oligopeptide transport system substrate-binding protein